MSGRGPINQIGYGAMNRGMTPVPRPQASRQTADQNLGAIQNQPPPVDLSKYYAQQQAMWDKQAADMASLRAAAMANVQKLNQLYDPSLGAGISKQIRAMYNTSDLTASHNQLMDLLGYTNPRMSTASWMMGFN